MEKDIRFNKKKITLSEEKSLASAIVFSPDCGLESFEKRPLFCIFFFVKVTKYLIVFYSFIISALKKATVVASIHPQWKSGICYYHSFATTENYVIFIEQPLVIITMKLLTATMKGKCLRDCMEWYPNDSVKGDAQ